MLKLRHADLLALRLPWLPFAVVDRLEALLPCRASVFEYGSGGSTAWFVDRGATVVSIEHDADWYENVSRALGDRPNWSLQLRPLDSPTYVDAIGDAPDGAFDVVLIDGRERLECLKRAMPKVRPGGLLILDDIERERYRPAFTWLADWPLETVHGFAPCRPIEAHTAIWTRPQHSVSPHPREEE
jgi:precorrin-6B methylase 2